MKRFLPTALFLLLCLSVTAKPIIIFRINTTECLKCYAAQIYADQLAHQTKVVLLFPSHYNTYQRFLDKQFPVDVGRYEIMQSDSIYEHYSQGGLSEIFLVDEGKTVFTCQVREISRQFHRIVELVNGNPVQYTSVRIPDSLLPGQPMLSAVDDKFLLFDRMLQQVLIYNGNDFLEMVPENYPVKDLYPFFDSSSAYADLFDQHLDLLRQVGKTEPSFNSCFLDEQGAMIFVQVPYPVVQEDGNLGIKMKSFVLDVGFPDMKETWYLLDENSVPENRYLLVKQPIVARDSGQLIVALTNQNCLKDHDFRYLAGFNYHGDTLVFDDFLEYELPRFHQKHKVYYEQLYPRSKKGLIYHQFANETVDLHSNTASRLPIENTKFEIDLTRFRMDYDILFTDVVKQGETYRFLYRTTDGLVFIGACEEKLLTHETQPVELPEAGSNPAFADFNTIAFFDPAKKSICYRVVR